jgi:hypothetical protein
MDITCIREEHKTSGHFRNYDVFNLLDGIDCLLSEHGFVSGEDRKDTKMGVRYKVYEGTEGYVVVRFVTDNSRLIPFVLGKKEFRAPIYVEQHNVPDLIGESIKKDLSIKFN